MTGAKRAGATVRRWEIALACVAAGLVVAALTVAASTAVPPTIANLSSEVADGRTATAVGDAAVIVPAEWLIVRESGDAIAVSTPDGVLRARIDAVGMDPATVVDDADAAGTLRTELLASGLTVVHADVDGGIVAAVGEPDAGESVRVTVEVVAPGRDAARDYRPAIGELLESVRR